MRSLFIAVTLALAAAPRAVAAQDDPAAPRRAVNDAASSFVLTPQGVRRQTEAQSTANPTKPDVAQRPSLPTRPSLMDVVTSLACTSMFARRPDTQGTDPAASAGR